MTRQLYYEDAYQTECEAKVLSSAKGKDGYEVIIDQTVFYPEGGGQAGDIGTLDGIKVIDTIEKDGFIIHITNKELEIGKKVKACINWEKRLHYSTRHSGEHVFSGIINQMLGYNNVGFHMGEDYVTVDFSGIVSIEDATEAELKTNEIIGQNKKIEVLYPTKEEKLTFRCKKEIKENLRIIRIKGADVCACCGTHVAYTGEIIILKVIAIETIRGGSRLVLKIGKDAYEDYKNKHFQVKQISNMLSVKPEKTAETVEKLVVQNSELKYQLQQLKEKWIEEVVNKVFLGTEKEILFLEDITPDEIRRVCDKLMGRAEISAVFSGTDKEGYSFVLGSQKQDVVDLGKKINQKFEGRGGGKNSMFQGKIMASRKQIEEFLS